MGLLSRSLGIRALSMEDPAQPLLPSSVLFESLGLGLSDAGVLVNEQRAIAIPTVQSCLRVISEDLASNDHQILQALPDGSVRVAQEHPRWGLIHDRPNPYTTAPVFWAALIAGAAGWGNGYAWIKRNQYADPLYLVLLKPGLTAPVNINGQRMYATTQTTNGEVAYIEPADMLHVPALSFDGIIGLSPVRTAMNAHGLSLAAEKFGAQFFGNGARSTGVFTHPGILEDDAYANLQKSAREMATGDNALRPMILEEGLKWVPLTIPPNEAQFLETRRYQRIELCGLYRVTPHLIGELDRATNNNIEHLSMVHVRYCLRAWGVKLEREVTTKLLGGSYFMEHDYDSMLRGDFASRTAGVQVLRNIGIGSTNDCRRYFRMAPLSDSEGGNLVLVQGAMISLASLVGSQATEQSGQDGQQPGGADPRRSRLMAAFARLWRDAVGRVTNRTSRDPQAVRKIFQPVVASLAEAMLASRYGQAGLTKHEEAAIGAQLDTIVAQADQWTKERAGQVADEIGAMVYEGLAEEILR